MSAAPPTDTSAAAQGSASQDATRKKHEQEMIFHSLEDYCWEDDPEFQSGLDSILANTISPSEVRDLTQKAKCYFYSRKINIPINFPAYQEWLHQQEAGVGQPPAGETPGPAVVPTPADAAAPTLPMPCQTDTGETTNHNTMQPSPPVPHAVLSVGSSSEDKKEEKAPYPMSFAHIVELIKTGQPIPGIKEIPDTLNTDAPSVPVKEQRRKPWEAIEQQQQDGVQEHVPTAVARE